MPRRRGSSASGLADQVQHSSGESSAFPAPCVCRTDFRSDGLSLRGQCGAKLQSFFDQLTCICVETGVAAARRRAAAGCSATCANGEPHADCALKCTASIVAVQERTTHQLRRSYRAEVWRWLIASRRIGNALSTGARQCLRPCCTRPSRSRSCGNHSVRALIACYWRRTDSSIRRGPGRWFIAGCRRAARRDRTIVGKCQRFV